MSARYLLSAFTSVALLGMAVPALSADVEPEKLSAWSGQLEAWLGYMFITDDRDVFESEDDDTDFFGFGVDGKLRIDLSDGLSVQADASYEDFERSLRGYEGGVLFGGHLSWSDPDSFLIGAFGAWSDGDTRSVDDDSYEAWAFGGEAQIYLDAVTLYGQLGYMDSEETGPFDPEDSFHDAYFGRVVGRYFLDPETRLQAEFVYANGDQDTDEKNMDVFGWGARADHQIMDMMSVFVAYNGHYYDNGNGPDTGAYAEHVVRGGISLAFGRPDLLSVDRTGTNLDLPQIGRWAAGGINVD